MVSEAVGPIIDRVERGLVGKLEGIREIAFTLHRDYESLDEDAKFAVLEEVAPEFVGAIGHNEKKILRELLMLLSHSDVQLQFFVKRSGQHKLREVSARDACELSKHDINSAAKALREMLGTDRSPGGGRRREPRYDTAEDRRLLLQDIRMSREALISDEFFIRRLREILQL